MRSQGDGKGIQLNPPFKLSLERALEYIGRMSTWKQPEKFCVCAKSCWMKINASGRCRVGPKSGRGF